MDQDLEREDPTLYMFQALDTSRKNCWDIRMDQDLEREDSTLYLFAKDVSVRLFAKDVSVRCNVRGPPFLNSLGWW